MQDAALKPYWAPKQMKSARADSGHSVVLKDTSSKPYETLYQMTHLTNVDVVKLAFYTNSEYKLVNSKCSGIMRHSRVPARTHSLAERKWRRQCRYCNCFSHHPAARRLARQHCRRRCRGPGSPRRQHRLRRARPAAGSGARWLERRRTSR